MNDPSFSAFLEDVIGPLAVNHRLWEPRHYRPLLLAFHAYGLPATTDDAAQARAQLRQALDRPAANSPQRWTRVWSIFQHRSDRLTVEEFSELAGWWRDEAAQCRVVLPTQKTNSRSHRSSPLDGQSMHVFHQVFHDFVQKWSANPTPPPRLPPADPTARQAWEETPLLELDDEPAPRYVTIDSPDVVRPPDLLQLEEFLSGVRARGPQILAAAEAFQAAASPAGLMWDELRETVAAKVLQVPVASTDEPVWFIGDVHGDLVGLKCLLHYIEQQSQGAAPRVVFLGDLFDDGRLSYETVLLWLEFTLATPGNTLLLAGNHDEGLGYDGQRFTASVQPCEFSDWLNQPAADDTARRVGQLVIRLVGDAPRAVFLSDGTLAAHGGVPHSDLVAGLESRDDLNSPACLQDFVWTRLHERARRRIPNRTTRGCELGREDFELFCRRAGELLDQPVRQMIRGHDHIDENDRCRVFAQYTEQLVVTINTMSHRLDREGFGGFHRRPCLVRWQPAAPLEIHRVTVPEELVQQAYHLADTAPGGSAP